MLDKSTLLGKSSNSEADTVCLPSTVIDGIVGDSNSDKNFCSDPATTNPWLRIHTGNRVNVFQASPLYSRQLI